MERHGNGSQEEHREQEPSSSNSESSSPNPDEGAEVDALVELIGEETFEHVPPESRGRITRSISIFTSIGGERFNPLFRRLSPEHISAMLESSERNAEREHSSQASARRYQFLYFLIGLLAAVGLIVFFSLTDDKVTLTTVIVAILGFVGGFGVGRTTRRS